MMRVFGIGPPTVTVLRIGAALAAALLLAASAGAQLRSTQRLPLVTIPPAPEAGQNIVPIPPPSGVTPVARSLLPTGVQIMRDAQGTGIVIYGALTGKADSALAVLSGFFAYSQAFDRRPSLQLILADRDDQRVQALFTAAADGSAVIGVAVIALSDSGGDISVFYDYAASFPASFGRLRQALSQSGGTGTVPLAPVSLADGSKIGIPQGWRVVGQGAGAVDLLGPLGEFVSLGATVPVYSRSPGYGGVQTPCCDPVKSLQAVYPQIAAVEQRIGVPPQFLAGIVASQPATAPTGGEAAFVLANLSVGGRPFTYFALVQAVAGFTDPWTLTLSGAMAPQAIFAEEFPTLLRIWGSHTANPPDFADRLQQAARGMDATAQMLQATITARDTADYNAGEGWEPAIRGLEAAEAGQYRLDDTLAQPLADLLAKDTGRSWRVVPLSEFR